MTKSILRMICVAIIVILTISCTVQKRLHQPGFHVEWRKPLKAKESAYISDKIDNPVNQESITSFPSEDSEVTLPAQTTQHIAIAGCEEQKSASPKKAVLNQSKNEHTRIIPTQENEITTSNNNQEPDIRIPKKRFEPVGVVSFSLILLAIIVFAFSPLIFDEMYYLLVFGILAIAAFCCGLYSLLTTKKFTNTFRKNGFGKVGLILSSIAIGMGIFVLLLNSVM